MSDASPPTPQPNPFSVPEEIGGYRIQRVLGAGGMATVYAAMQKQPRRTVALKVMKAGVAGENTLRRFKREVEILGKLRHPYIAQVYDAGTHEDVSGATIPYFVMEYVPGAKTLLEFVSMNNLDIRERLKLFVKICAAIEHGHRAKIIHRDLKPGNILIDESGEPKIIDFGVSHTTDMDITAAAGGQTMITEAGRLVGTLHYMSPEQVDTTRHDLDARCDVYALGVVLYKLTTGRFPVDVEAVPLYEAVRLIREKLPTRPSEVNPAVKGDLETIILKSLEKDRLRRYRNAGSLGRDIVRYLAGKPIHGRRAGLLYRSALFVRRHRAASIAAIVVLLTIAGACGAVMWNRAMVRREAQQIIAARQSNVPSIQSTTTQPAPAQLPPADITLSVHAGRIVGLKFSPDGSLLVSAAQDGTAIIWNVADGSALHTISGDGGSLTHLAMSGDGKLITASARGHLTIVDVASGRVMREVHRPCEAIGALSLSHDGMTIACACDDLTVRVIRNETIETLRGTTGRFSSADFSDESARLVTGSERGPVYVWNLDSKSTAAPQRFDQLKAEVMGVMFIDSENAIIAVAADGTAARWSLTDSAHVGFQAATQMLTAAAFSIDAQLLACLAGESATVWNVQASTPTKVGRTVELKDTATAVAIDRDGTRIALGFLDGSIRIVPIAHSNQSN